MRQKVIRAIQVHAQEQYPRECCGAIAQRGRVERYFPVVILPMTPGAFCSCAGGLCTGRGLGHRNGDRPQSPRRDDPAKRAG